MAALRRRELWDQYFRSDTGTLDGDRMLTDIAALLAELEGLRADAARLDWLQSIIEPDTRIEINHYAVNEHKVRGDYVHIGKLIDIEDRISDGTHGDGNSLREALDRARAEGR